MKFTDALLIGAVLLVATPAVGAHRGTPVPVAVTAPVLTNTAVTFGRQTGTGRGGVHLNSQDMTMTSFIPFTFSGFGLMSPAGAPCATITLTFDHNSAGRPATDFTIPAANADATTAKTPTPSSTGVGHLDGDYYWNAVCKDAGGHTSNTAQIKYQTQDKMANIGEGDRLDIAGVIPAGFGTTSGYKIVFSTGGDWLATNLGLKFPHSWTNQVVITVADPGRYPKMSNFSGVDFSLVRWTDIVISGSQSIASSRAQVYLTTSSGLTQHDVEVDNIRYYGNQTWLDTSPQYSGQSFVNVLSCSANCSVHDNFADFSQSGFPASSNVDFVNNMFSHYFNNGLFFPSTGNMKINDNIWSAPARFSATHVDACQFADSATVWNLEMLRNTAATAGGNTNAQGFCFPGGQVSITGYISDGTGTAPGHILTKVTGNPSNSAIANTFIISPGALTVADGVQILSPANGSGPWTLNIPGGDMLLGSPSSPVTFRSPWGWNWHVSGIMNAQGGYHALDLNGAQGTSSWSNGSYASHEANPYYATTWQGTISPGIVTIIGPITNTISYAPQPYYIYGRLSFSGCDYCSTSDAILDGSQITSTVVRGSVTAGISGNVMAVTDVSGGLLPAIGDFVVGTGVSATTKITSVPSVGYPIGNYNLSKTAVVPSGSSLSINTPNQQGTYSSATTKTATLQNITSSDSFPVSNNTFLGLANCSFPEMWAGTFNIDSLYIQNGYSPTAGCPPSGASITNMSSNSTVTASDFASGMFPKDYLAAIPASVWDSYLSTDQVQSKKLTVARMCLAFKPSSGGSIGMHSAITPATNPDGSGGGDWIVDGVASTHIDGCEAIP